MSSFPIAVRFPKWPFCAAVCMARSCRDRETGIRCLASNNQGDLLHLFLLLHIIPSFPHIQIPPCKPPLGLILSLCSSFRSVLIIISCFSSAAGMADHFAVMAGRLLTESTVQSAIDEVSVVPSSTSTMAASACDEAVEDDRPKSGVLVECRICQEEDDDTCMEAPCSCKGSLKHAHRKCIQRWCDEKGDTICEICLQQFTPNYTAPSKLFQQGRNSIFFRTPGYIQAQATTDQSYATSTSNGYDHYNSTPKGVVYCRITAITLMLLMVLHDAISVFLGDHNSYTVALITLLMLRTTGIVIPVYVILVSVTELLHRRNQRQAMRGQILERGGAGSTAQPVPAPPQQQLVVISIQ